MIKLMCATVCLCEQDKDTRDGPTDRAYSVLLLMTL